MKTSLKYLLVAWLILPLVSLTAWAQATAQISGTVTDQTRALLPGVEITATQTATGLVRTVISNESGAYVIGNLPTGPYRLDAALPGFRTYAQTGIVLEVNSNPVINVILEVGQVTETIEVEANAAMVETRSVGVGQVIESARILELPLDGRNVAALITLNGGAIQTGTSGNRSFAGAPIVSVSGGLGFGTSYNLDGANHVDPYNGQSLPLPFPEALQEFQVESSGLSAQRGQGSAVNAVTKSGTNQLHGSLFEFARNDLFNARSYFSETGSTLKRHQFGGTIGGPIVKNSIFFFTGYQGTTLRQDPADFTSRVPTQAMLAGDFTAFASPGCNAGRQLTLGSPFVNNQVDPRLFSAAALNIMKQLPRPADPCGEIRYGRKTDQNDWQSVSKVDYQNSRYSLFGRYMATHSVVKNPFDVTPEPLKLLNSPGRGYDNFAQAYAAGSTFLIGANTVQSVRLTVNRVAVHRIGSEFFGPTDIGINAYTYVPKYMVLSVTGGFAVGGGTSTPSHFITTSYQLSDDLSLVHGSHQIGVGGSLLLGKSISHSNSLSTGSYAFNGQSTTSGMADFVLGRLSGFTQAGPRTLPVHQWVPALYAQDVWKATPTFTLNYGVRWSPFLPQELNNGAVYNFDYQRFQQGIKSAVFLNAPAGLYYPGDPGFPGKKGLNNQWMKFGPRLGLAWDVKGDGSTSIRASYGLNNEYLPLQWRIDASSAPPHGNELALPSPAGGLDNPWQGIPGGNLFPYDLNASSRFGPSGTYQTMSYDLNTMYAQAWNLTVQRAVLTDWLVSASYLGTQAVHVWAQRSLNPAVYFPGSNCTLPNGVFIQGTCSTTGNTNLRRRLTLERPNDGQYIGILGEFDDGGTQSYHGMLLSVRRRAGRGVNVSANYTWSHCIGDFTDAQGQGPGAGETYQDPNNRALDRANCSSDRRHAFNMTAVAETPRFANPTVRMLATGWRLSGIYRKSSGSWLTVTSGVDRALNGNSNQRANQVLPDSYDDRSAGPMTKYLNTAAFTLPALGTLGNVGRATIEGPGTWQFDMSLSRIFEFRETQQLEFRAEAYNVTNSFRPGNPATALNSNVFGEIRTALEPRIMQFALKYVF